MSWGQRSAAPTQHARPTSPHSHLLQDPAGNRLTGPHPNRPDHSATPTYPVHQHRIPAPATSTQVLRRVAHGFTNPNNFAARGLLVT